MPRGYSRTIICLAASRKHSGRCVAGKTIDGARFGDWIRPVNTAGTGELFAPDRCYDGGTEPALLDVITIRMLGKSAHQYQPENHVIDNKCHWSLVRKATYAEASRATDATPRDLWGSSFGSSYSGVNDRVPVASAPDFNCSLRLICVTDLRIRVSVEGAAFGGTKRNLRGFFTYFGNKYAFAITDHIAEKRYLSGHDDDVTVGEALLCVGLGEPHRGYAYKLIAGVLTK